MSLVLDYSISFKLNTLQEIFCQGVGVKRFGSRRKRLDPSAHYSGEGWTPLPSIHGEHWTPLPSIHGGRLDPSAHYSGGRPDPSAHCPGWGEWGQGRLDASAYYSGGDRTPLPTIQGGGWGLEKGPLSPLRFTEIHLGTYDLLAIICWLFLTLI